VQQPSRTLTLRPRLTAAEDSLRPTRAEIDLDAIAHNLRVVRRAAGGARVLAVVKADAYGHGVVPVVTRLAAEGVDAFGVALAEEALELREAGVDAPVLVLNGAYAGAHREVLEAGLTPVVHDEETVRAFAVAWGDRPFGVHVEVDTGIGRLGVPAARLGAFLDALARVPQVRIDGLMTHFASADGDDAFTAEQLRSFAEARSLVAARGHCPRVVHAANSAALFRHPESRFDMVRPGIALFGVAPWPGPADDPARAALAGALRPAMRLRTEVIALRELAPGQTVGYSGTFRAGRPTRVATVPVGYGDGLLRAASNRAEMLVRGRRVPVIGNVSMDLTTLDVTDIPGVGLGDEVVLLGETEGDRLGAEDLARATGTIAYEVLTNVSRRVPRFYR
jgi:alanine racemase